MVQGGLEPSFTGQALRAVVHSLHDCWQNKSGIMSD